MLGAATVQAQADLRVVAMPTHDPEGSGQPAVDKALRRALSQREGLTLSPQPALDLEAVGLAFDCVGHTPECLSLVAKRAEADVLIAPALIAREGSVELRVLYYDARAKLRRFAARREPGPRLTQTTLDAMPRIVEELFSDGSESAAESADEDQSDDASADAAPDTAASEPEPTRASPATTGDAPRLFGLPLGPVITSSAGVLLLGGGIVAGLMMQSTERDYRALEVRSAEQAAEAEALRSRGEREALVSSVLLGVGAAAVAAGGVWLALQLGDTGERATASARLEPELGLGRAGLQLTGHWGAR